MLVAFNQSMYGYIAVNLWFCWTPPCRPLVTLLRISLHILIICMWPSFAYSAPLVVKTIPISSPKNVFISSKLVTHIVCMMSIFT